MRRSSGLIVLSILLSSTFIWAGGADWLTNFDEAQQIAKKEDKLILADFTGSDWCGWCVRLDKEVFEQPEFKKYAEKNLVLLMVDFPRRKKQTAQVQKMNQALAQKYKIKGYPTILLLDHTGKVVAETGYRKGGAAKYVEHLEQISGKKQPPAPKPEKVGEFHWLTDYDQALALSRKENKPILVDFTGSDWCGWCIKLDKEVFSQKVFQEFAQKNLILLKIDFPARKKQSAAEKKQNEALQEKYNVPGYPTILILDKNGDILARTGYRFGGAEKYVKHLQELLKP